MHFCSEVIIAHSMFSLSAHHVFAKCPTIILEQNYLKGTNISEYKFSRIERIGYCASTIFANVKKHFYR